MHGLFNRSLQCFIVDTYGPGAWSAIAAAADLDPARFEALLIYDDRVTRAVIRAAAELLLKPEDDLLEDMGTFLVSNRAADSVRRLLRFGGDDFGTFLHSLNELPDRARLAMPDLDFPRLDLREISTGQFLLRCETPHMEYCRVTLGALRAMADDYGVLASVDFAALPGRGAEISLQVFDTGFSKGRSFSLGVRTA